MTEDSFARWCYACGDLNPLGLHMHFRMEGEWAVAPFVARREHQGYPGFVHGGIVSTLLDEAAWATCGRSVWAKSRDAWRCCTVTRAVDELERSAARSCDRGRMLR
jgi:hypothetical protein